MGNSNTSPKKTASNQNRGSQKNKESDIAKTFNIIAKNGHKVAQKSLVEFWTPHSDPKLLHFLVSYFFGSKVNPETATLDLKRFTMLYTHLVEGTITDQIDLMFEIAAYGEKHDTEITAVGLNAFVESVVSSFFTALAIQSGKEYKSWEAKGWTARKESMQPLSEFLCADFLLEDSKSISKDDAERWLQQNPLFLKMMQIVFIHLYHYTTIARDQIEYASKKRPNTVMLPICEMPENMARFARIIDIAEVAFLNSHLPSALQCKWRFLFSSQLHGESFSTFLGRILNQGPCLIIVEDNDGCIFGGFSPESWTLSPNFVGDETTFLFKLRPKMQCFSTTGYNDHYQYLNLHQQTMPNGLGMGGQFNYWGLWLDCEYGLGESAESCTTFKNYSRLCLDKKFKIKNIDVWALGELPTVDSDDEAVVKKSALDGNLEDKVILQLAGRTMHSDGIREEPEL